MTIRDIIVQETEHTYDVTERLFDLVDDDKLNWKPATGNNWMTLGQCVMHCTNACGSTMKGFITGDWGLPEGMKIEDLPPEDMLPPAEKLPTVESMVQAKELLRADRQTAREMLSRVDSEEMLNRRLVAPWGGPELTLLQHLMMSYNHLMQHKGQLFYYLKLQGKPVNTMHLWGAEESEPA